MGPWLPGFRISLKGKLTLFISLMVIGTCCTLSWYLIDQQAHALRASLIRTGTLLTERLASTSLFSVISQDRFRLKLLSEGTLAIPEIRYVRFFDSHGAILFADRKVLDAQFSLPPISSLSSENFPSNPLITPYQMFAQGLQPVAGHVTALQLTLRAVGTSETETIFDLVSPIGGGGPETTLDPSLLEDLAVTAQEQGEEALPSTLPYGYVQIGMSNQTLQKALLSTVRQVLLITLIIILLALSVTVFFAGRLVAPLRSLTSLATRVSKGDLSVTVPPTTTDEIGELTQSFNDMIQSLDHRDQALADQLRRLKTVNQTGTTITSSLDPTTVLDRVLDLLVKNLGFERALLMLYDSGLKRTYGARIAGVPLEVAESSRHISLSILPDDSFPSQVLLKGQPVLIPDLEDFASRIDPALLRLARSMEATSFIMVPLISHQRVLGFAGASRGAVLCTQDDLDLLSTIGSQVGVAIDNAQAYRQLESMMETLEHRVQERTNELRQANEKLRELDRIKSAVVTSVSHELRTPLTSIQMHVDNVLDGGTGPLGEEQKGFLTRVQKNTNRLRRIINEMLDLSRIESGQSSLNLSSITFSGVLREVLENLQPLIQERGLQVEATCDPLLPTLRVDEDKLFQILMNLIHNAIKFSLPHGHIAVTATLTVDQVLQVCVRDAGPGIPQEELSKIFLPFYRSSPTVVKGRGAGLGLAITKGLLELQGGKLWVESDEGLGSRFYFTLPLSPTSEPRIPSPSLSI